MYGTIVSSTGTDMPVNDNFQPILGEFAQRIDLAYRVLYSELAQQSPGLREFVSRNVLDYTIGPFSTEIYLADRRFRQMISIPY